MQFNELQRTNSLLHSLLLFFCSLTFSLPFSNQWYIEIYEPIILLIKLPCPRYIYFLPNLLFHFSSSLASVLSLRRSLSPSLSLSWPLRTFPHHTRLRDIKIDTKYNAAVAFTHNEVPDGLIKGLAQAASLTASWTWILPLWRNIFPLVLLLLCL